MNGLILTQIWGGRRESNLTPNVILTTYRATDGTKGDISTCKATQMAGEQQGMAGENSHASEQSCVVGQA